MVEPVEVFASVLYQRPSTRITGSRPERAQWCRSSDTADPTRWSKMWCPAVDRAV